MRSLHTGFALSIGGKSGICMAHELEYCRDHTSLLSHRHRHGQEAQIILLLRFVLPQVMWVGCDSTVTDVNDGTSKTAHISHSAPPRIAQGGSEQHNHVIRKLHAMKATSIGGLGFGRGRKKPREFCQSGGSYSTRETSQCECQNITWTYEWQFEHVVVFLLCFFFIILSQ